MDFLKAEMEKKRKALDQLEKDGKKYIKRGELERLREQQYREEQEREEQRRREKQARDLAAVGAGTRSPKTGKEGSLAGRGSPALGAKASESTVGGTESGDDDDDGTYNISNEDILRRFRARDEPIRLFGETDRQRIRRLRKLEAMEERTEGQRNDFRAALQKTDKALAMENMIRKSSTGDASEEVEDQFERKKRDGEKEVVDTSIISLDLLQKDPEKVRSLIGIYFKRVLKEWERTLNARPDDVKRSTQGKLQSINQNQSAEYLKPFFKQLKTGQIQPDVVARITEICQLMQQREYLQANDAYLRMSIGNAPWPIGVTMVGIHERSAREKIFSSQVAHVLNDETQRKWIQSIKRMMTFAQQRWPPDDNAKCIG
ncbi:mRNA splicing protein prp18 [Borealophlyctis nickersoniae]|nr:mRNA splicing protein prp18 [Borealophlyctis nickersoniae]